MLGDLNDVLTDNTPNNVFQNFIDDTGNYMIVDMDIATGSSSNWSYPGWPSHLDHIFITSELFTEYSSPASDIQVIKVDNFIQGGWSAYDANISDHRPVALKIDINVAPVSQRELATRGPVLQVYPNPSKGLITINIEDSELDRIDVYNATGCLVFSKSVTKNPFDIDLNQVGVSGLYLIQFYTRENSIIGHRKIILK